MSVPELEQIYEEYYRRVMGYISARIRNHADAEDLCADVFEKIAMKLPEYDETKAAIGTWIFTITRNRVIDFYRRSRPTEELDENLSDSAELDEDLLNSETLGELGDALNSLPRELTDILILRYYNGLPLTEVAKKMNLSYGAVKLRHQNALLLLRGKMQQLA